MSDVNVIRHAYESKYVDKKSSAVRRTSGYFNTKNIVGRYTDTKYGRYVKPDTNKNYASKYYDPVARHERYLRERSSLGIGKGRSGGSSRGRSGKSKGGKGSAANIAAEIEKLREESSLNTEAQREAARRKIEDLKEELKAQIEALSNREVDAEEGVNTAEIRGRIQSIQDEIQRTGGDLQKWITQEKEALERRIAAVYNYNGKQYKIASQSDKKNASEARDKEVKSRADSIYKKKS